MSWHGACWCSFDQDSGTTLNGLWTNAIQFQPRVVCLLRDKKKFSRVLITLELFVTSNVTVVLLVLESAAAAVNAWDAEDHRWQEKLSHLPLTIYGDDPSCTSCEIIKGIGHEQMAGLIRNADLVVPL